eukprot:6175387-Pleurochrysis_carterae.AAC.3
MHAINACIKTASCGFKRYLTQALSPLGSRSRDHRSPGSGLQQARRVRHMAHRPVNASRWLDRTHARGVKHQLTRGYSAIERTIFGNSDVCTADVELILSPSRPHKLSARRNTRGFSALGLQSAAYSMR